MPTYEYKCKSCGQVSEYRIAVQAEDKSLTCSSCGSSNLDRLISVPNISMATKASSAQTCCGKDQRCSDAGSCCGH